MRLIIEIFAAVLLVICVSLFLLHPEPDKSSYLDVGTYGIAGLLANGARGVAQPFRKPTGGA